MNFRRSEQDSMEVSDLIVWLRIPNSYIIPTHVYIRGLLHEH